MMTDEVEAAQLKTEYVMIPNYRARLSEAPIRIVASEEPSLDMFARGKCVAPCTFGTASGRRGIKGRCRTSVVKAQAYGNGEC